MLQISKGVLQIRVVPIVRLDVLGCVMGTVLAVAVEHAPQHVGVVALLGVTIPVLEDVAMDVVHNAL